MAAIGCLVLCIHGDTKGEDDKVLFIHNIKQKDKDEVYSKSVLPFDFWGFPHFPLPSVCHFLLAICVLTFTK